MYDKSLDCVNVETDIPITGCNAHIIGKLKYQRVDEICIGTCRERSGLDKVVNDVPEY